MLPTRATAHGAHPPAPARNPPACPPLQASDLALAASGLGVDEAVLARLKAVDLGVLPNLVAAIKVYDSAGFTDLGARLARRLGECSGAPLPGGESKALCFYKELLTKSADLCVGEKRPSTHSQTHARTTLTHALTHTHVPSQPHC